MPHKRIHNAVEAFNRLRLPLVVIGNGPDARRLRRMAGPTISFAGRVSDERAAELLSASRALVVTATEEFGIAAVEAQAAGRPVIALAEGGVRETVQEGVTGDVLRGGRPRRAGRRGAPASTRWPSIRPSAWPTPTASTWRTSATASAASSPRPAPTSARRGADPRRVRPRGLGSRLVAPGA